MDIVFVSHLLEGGDGEFVGNGSGRRLEIVTKDGLRLDLRNTSSESQAANKGSEETEDILLAHLSPQ